MQTDQTEIIKQKMEDVMKASHKLAESIYQQTAQQGTQTGSEQDQQAGSEQPQESETADDAVDADFEVVDDDKK